MRTLWQRLAAACRKLGSRHASSGCPKRQRSFHLEVEALEGRLVPSSVLVVSSTADSGAGTLRAAVTQANTDAGNGISDAINFSGLAAGSTVTLTSGTLQLTAASGGALVTIDGTTQNITIDSGSSKSKAAICTAFTVAAGANVSIANLTVTDGITPNYSGGPPPPTTYTLTGISFSSGVTQITTGSKSLSEKAGDALSGPGIATGTTLTGTGYTTSGKGNKKTYSYYIDISQPTTAAGSGVTLIDVQPPNTSSNSNVDYTVAPSSSVNGNGGAIDNAGSVSVSNCTFINNAVSGNGGAIYNASTGSMVVNGASFGVLANGYTNLDTTTYPQFNANYATGNASVGGAIYNAGTMTVQNASLLGNFLSDESSSNDGAGIYNAGTGTMTINNSTLADETGGSDAHGGAIYNNGLMSVTDSTLYGNRVFFSGTENTGEGSGIYNDATGMLTVSDSTIANNNGGIANLAGGAVVLMGDIVFGNLHDVSPNETDLNGAFSGSDNLIGDISSSDGTASGTNEGLNSAGGIAVGIDNGANGNQVGSYGKANPFTPSLNPDLLPIGIYLGTIATMPIISGTGTSTNPWSPAVANASGQLVAGGVANVTLPFTLSAGATFTVDDPAAIAATAQGAYQLQVGSDVFSAGLVSGSTFVVNSVISGVSGSTVAAGPVFFASYENGDPRVFGGATAAGAAEYFTFSFASTGQPPSAPVAVMTPFQISVATLDQSGVGLPGVKIAIDLDGNTAATLSGPVSGTTNSSGVATFAGLNVDTPGTYALSATVSTVTAQGASQNTSGSGNNSTIPTSSTSLIQVSNDFVVLQLPGSISFTTQPPNTAAGSQFSPVVSVVDVNGNSVGAGAVVTLNISSNTVYQGTYTATAATSSITGTTDSSGTVTFSNLDVQLAGSYTLSASATDASVEGAAWTAAGASNTFAISAHTASVLSFVTQPGSTTAGSTINAVTLQVNDQYGNVVANTAIAIQTTAPQKVLSGGTLTLTTNSQGQVTFSNLIENTAGTYTLSASASGLYLGTSSSFVIAASAANETMAFTTEPAVGPTKAGSTLNTVVVTVTDKYGNPVAGGAVTLSISTSGTIAAGNVTATAGSDGTVSFSGLTVQKSGTFTLTATAGTLTKKSTSFVISAGTAQQFAFVTQPANVLAGCTISPAVSVSVADQYGNGVAGISVTLATGAAPLSGTTTVVSNSAGLATFTNLAEKTVGTYTLTATAPSGLGTVSNQFVVSLSEALEKMTFTTQPTASVAGNALSGPVVVEIVDRYGNLVSGDTVNLAISSPGVLNSGSATAVTDSTGQATFSGLTVDKSGAYTLTASSNGLPSAVSGKFAISASTPAALALVSQPQNTCAGKNVCAVKVQVVDAFGNPCLIAGEPVTMSIASPTNAAATLTGTTTAMTTGIGVAVFSALSETSVGAAYTLTASATTLGLTNSLPSNPFTVSAGTPKTLVFENLPSNTTAGSTLNLSGVVLQVTDSYGNPVPNTAVSVGASPGTLSAGFTPLRTDSNGLVTFSNLTENKAGSYTLIAAVSAAVRTTAPFTIAPAAAYGLSFTAQPTTTRANATINNVTVQIVDRYGNAVGSSGFISLALVAPRTSKASLGGTTSLPASASGNAVFNTLQVQTVGTYSLVASDTGDNFVGAASKSFTIVSGTPTSMAFVTQPANGQFINSQLAAATGPVIVQLYDQFGNLATQANTSIVITITNLTTGTTSTREALTNSQGKAVFNLLLAAAGTYELTATSVPVVTASEMTLTPFDSATSNTFVVTQAARRWY